jgi:hypothetical protein
LKFEISDLKFNSLNRPQMISAGVFLRGRGGELAGHLERTVDNPYLPPASMDVEHRPLVPSARPWPLWVTIAGGSAIIIGTTLLTLSVNESSPMVWGVRLFPVILLVSATLWSAFVSRFIARRRTRSVAVAGGQIWNLTMWCCVATPIHLKHSLRFQTDGPILGGFFLAGASLSVIVSWMMCMKNSPGQY